MPITDTEVVPEVASIQVGTQNEAVLIYFVGIIWDEPYPRCESILCDNISLDKLRSHSFFLL